MKKCGIYCILLLAAMCLLPHMRALAWTAESYYDEPDELPQAVREALPPKQDFIFGLGNRGTIFVLAGAENDTRKILVFDQVDGNYTLTAESAPLCKWRDSNAGLGSGGKDCIHVIYEDGSAYFSFIRTAEDTWRLAYVEADESFDFAHKGVLRDMYGDRFVYGITQSIELSAVEIENLPITFDQALSFVNTDGWAAVANGAPAKRTCLRAEPFDAAVSYGEYCPGTPVQVFQIDGGWAQVSVFGVEGYMPRDCLALGEDMLGVQRLFLHKTVRAEAIEEGACIYAEPAASADIVRTLAHGDDSLGIIKIVGIVGNDWYHVLYLDDVAGYMKADNFWDGNG